MSEEEDRPVEDDAVEEEGVEEEGVEADVVEEEGVEEDVVAEAGRPSGRSTSGGRERQRRAGGRRAARLAEARRRQARARRRRLRAGMRQVGVAVLVVAVLVGVVVVASTVVGGGGDPADVVASDSPDTPVVAQQTLLLVREGEEGEGAAGLTLLAVGEDGSASATFIPSTTLVEVPGVGLDRLGLALQYGGGGLTAATVENALGIEIDHVAVVAPADLAAFIQRAGGAEIDIDQRLVARAADGTGTVAFEAGEQFLNGVRLAEYWGFIQRGETELDTFPRQQRALDALLRALADDDLRDDLLATTPPELSTDADPDALQQVLGGLAEAAADEVAVYQLLPVEPFGSGDEASGASYQLQAEEVQELVAASLAGSVPDGGGDGPVRVQVLNGVGTPGVGQLVDEAIEGLGLRITLTENARSFDFLETQIVIYAETPAMLQAAEQVRAAMGVGTILVSRQPQSVVDMTIVVGADFLGIAPTAPAGTE